MGSGMGKEVPSFLPFLFPPHSKTNESWLKVWGGNSWFRLKSWIICLDWEVWVSYFTSLCLICLSVEKGNAQEKQPSSCLTMESSPNAHQQLCVWENYTAEKMDEL